MSELGRAFLKRSNYKNTENSIAFLYTSNKCLNVTKKKDPLSKTTENCLLYWNKMTQNCLK